ncbi:MAG TPA: thioesterase family protein [Nitrososphaerales archaeon]|nr:thioesterase family protein [Nitrososphaerales archaeon]
MKAYRYRTRVTWVDTDAARVAHFSNYFRYFERAEQEFYNKLGVDPFGGGDDRNIWLPRVEANCRYLSPCKLNDMIEVELTASAIGAKSIKYEFGIRNLTTEKDAAKGYVVVVSASASEGHSIPLPEDFSSRLRKFFRV